MRKICESSEQGSPTVSPTISPTVSPRVSPTVSPTQANKFFFLHVFAHGFVPAIPVDARDCIAQGVAPPQTQKKNMLLGRGLSLRALGGCVTQGAWGWGGKKNSCHQHPSLLFVQALARTRCFSLLKPLPVWPRCLLGKKKNLLFVVFLPSPRLGLILLAATVATRKISLRLRDGLAPLF